MIPVTIHLTPNVFNRLEALANKRGITMRQLIASTLEPKDPARIVGNIRSPRLNGYRHLSDDEWAQIRGLRAAGWTVPRLAVRFQCSSSTIYKRLQKEANERNAV